MDQQDAGPAKREIASELGKEGNSPTCVKCRGIVIGIPVPKGQMLCGSTRMRYVNQSDTQEEGRHGSSQEAAV